jgi:hypothetical protein
VTGDVTELQGSREVLPKLFVMSISGKLSTGEDASAGIHNKNIYVRRVQPLMYII